MVVLKVRYPEGERHLTMKNACQLAKSKNGGMSIGLGPTNQELELSKMSTYMHETT